MSLSNLGRIVVIDDQFKEAEPLLQIFSKGNIPYLYFDGKQDNLPEKPFNGIRFIFLDIQIGTFLAGQPEKNKAAAIISYLKKIISVDNGPYAIIAWTKHPEIIGYVKDECKQNNIPPLLILDLEKWSVISSDEDNNIQCDFKSLTTKLEDKLKEIGAFQFYIEWENIVNNSLKEFVSQFSMFFPTDDNWSDKTRYLLYKLYKSYVEQNEPKDDSQKFYYAAHLLNRSFSDFLENNTIELTARINFDFFNIRKIKGGLYDELSKKGIKSKLDQYYKQNDDSNFELKESDTVTQKALKTISSDIEKAILNDEIIANINTSLFLTMNPQLKKAPGCFYKVEDTEMHELLSENIFKTEFNDKNKTELCRLIITPECDIAQNKLMMHRLIYGLICYKNKFLFDIDDINYQNILENKQITDEFRNIFVTHSCSLSEKVNIEKQTTDLFSIKDNDSNYIIKKEKNKLVIYRNINIEYSNATHLFIITPIIYQRNILTIILNLQSITSIPEEKLGNSQPLFSLKRDLLFDIQSKAANHVNRLGNYLLK